MALDKKSWARAEGKETDEALQQKLRLAIEQTRDKELFPRKVAEAKAFFAHGVVLPPTK